MLPFTICMLASAGAPLTADNAVVLALENAHALQLQEVALAERDKEAGRMDLQPLRATATGRSIDALARGDLSVQNLYGELSWQPPALEEFGTAQAIAHAGVTRDMLRGSEERAALASEVRQLHARVLLMREERDVVMRAVELSGKIKTSVDDQLRAEVATRMQASIASLDLLDSKVDLDELEARLARSEARLSQLLGIDLPPLLGPAPVCVAPPPAESVLAQARTHAWRLKQIDVDRTSLRDREARAWLRRIPWVSALSLGVLQNRPIDHRTEVHVGLTVELPVFRLVRGVDSELSVARARVESDAIDAEDALDGEVETAVTRQAASAALVQAHGGEVDALAKQGEAAINAAVVAGSVASVDAAALHKRTQQSRRTHLHAIARCVEASLEVQRLIGDPASSSGAPQDSPR